MQATESQSFEQTLAKLPSTEQLISMVLARINHIRPIPAGALILDVGAAQGRGLIACSKAGYHAVGVEPNDEAREMAVKIAVHTGLDITILKGTAEALPVADNAFDVVLCSYVLEHVSDAQAAMNEAYRVLKPGGVFWFSSTSSVCPCQNEIRVFPLFGWYPDPLKRFIMDYAKDHKPHLIGGTNCPAINWFTPKKARRMLRQAGFSSIYDRWDLRLASEGGLRYRVLINAIRHSSLTKLAADVLVPDCAYAAWK